MKSTLNVRNSFSPQFTSLMGLHVLQGDRDKALQLMDAAITRGFLFIETMKEPYLQELTDYAAVSERI